MRNPRIEAIILPKNQNALEPLKYNNNIIVNERQENRKFTKKWKSMVKIRNKERPRQKRAILKRFYPNHKSGWNSSKYLRLGRHENTGGRNYYDKYTRKKKHWQDAGR